MKLFPIYPLLALAASAKAEVLALGCVIDLPDCYWLDTRSGSYTFRCFDDPEELGSVSVHEQHSDFTDTTNYAPEALYQVDDLIVERLVFEGEVKDVPSIRIRRGTGVMLFVGDATKLVPEAIDQCTNNPFP